MIPAWKPIIKEAHDNGSKIAMQIVHGGIKRRKFLPAKMFHYAPSPLFRNWQPRAHHEMTDEEIEGIIADFVAAGVTGSRSRL